MSNSPERAVRPPAGRRFAHGARAALALTVLAGVAAAQGLGAPPEPWENPVTAEKAVLGKILFWDEQLASDNTVACATCHHPSAGGADPRVGRNPGYDGAYHTADDVLGSPGVVLSAANGDFVPDPLFGLHSQVTGRTAPTNIGAAYFSTLRWDGLAIETFVDPVNGQAAILFGGALESHAIGPPGNGAEMAYARRTWSDIAAKIQRVRPLALATDLTPDLVTALAGDPSYGELTRRAFGDTTVTARRIIYAIATYQRTLVPDQTPWDRFANGDPNALTADQRAGLLLFENAAGCARCHSMPLFSDGSFRNVGLRPVREDFGWQLATSDPIDRGKFKVPTLRNAGLRNRFMHNGRFATLESVVELYDQGGGPFLDNKDPILAPLNLTPTQKAQLVDFVRNGLADPRVAAGLPPFDAPTLYSERAYQAFGAAHPGSGGIAPRTVFDAPPLVGNSEFRLGLVDALGGAPAAFVFAGARGPAGQRLGPLPIHLALTPPPILQSFVLSGSGPGAGYGTFHLPIPGDAALLGVPLYHQGFVIDPGAAGGIAATPGAGGPLF